MSIVQKVSFRANDDFKWLAVKQSPDTKAVNESNNKKLKAAVYVSSATAVTAIGMATVVLSRGKNNKALGKKIDSVISKFDNMNTHTGTNSENVNFNFINSAVDSLKSSLNKLEERVSSLASDTIKAMESSNINKSKLEEKTIWYDNYLKALTERQNSITSGLSNHNFIGRNMEDIDGMFLLRNIDNDGKPIELKKEIKSYLQNISKDFIYGSDSVKPKPLEKNSTIWSLTAESIPEKDGGLGEVPVQIAKNMTNLGIDNYIVRPMILIPGRSKLTNNNGKFIYSYDINDPVKRFDIDLDLVAKFKTEVFRDGHPETITVNVYTGFDKKQNHKRLMFDCNDYFTAKGLYKNTHNVSENERYALFPKLVYDFTKYLMDPNSITNIERYEKFSELKVPSSMILNDWHTGSLAALMRLKAPVEAAEEELSKNAADTLKKMNLININHNLNYQGNDWAHKSDILNTLFGKYAYDIYKYAETGFSGGISKALTIDGNVNLANMGACYSTKMRPVSPTYAYEISHDMSKGFGMTHILSERYAAKTLSGRSNGWDRSVNEISAGNINGFNNALNRDKFLILKHYLAKINGLSDSAKETVNQVISKKINVGRFMEGVSDLRNINSDVINKTLDELESKGILKLRNFVPNTNIDSIDKIISAKKSNKAQLIDMINSMIEHDSAAEEKDVLFNITNLNVTSMKNVKPEDLDDTIVFNMGVRFADQKGVDVAAASIKRVINEWETKYPGRKKPIFIVGGKDDEGGKIKQYILDLKKELGQNGERVVHMDGYVPNNILQGGSDFTMYSSHFEPDGAKWESLYKGTPVICTRVGGHIDSVKDGVNGFLSKRTVSDIKEELKLGTFIGDEQYPRYLKAMSDDYTDAIYRAVDSFYSGKHIDMIRNAIDGEQSWVIKDAEANVTGGTLLEYLKDLGFNLKDFPEIKIAT